MEDPRIARTYHVSGSVQGVGFRHFARLHAERLGVAGYAKNLRDGRLEIYAIGTRDALAAFRRKIEQGPQAAAVWEVAEDEAQLLPRFDNDFFIEQDI